MLFDFWPSKSKVVFAFLGASAIPQLAKKLACRLIRRVMSWQEKKNVGLNLSNSTSTTQQPNNQCLYLDLHYELTGGIKEL